MFLFGAVVCATLIMLVVKLRGVASYAWGLALGMAIVSTGSATIWTVRTNRQATSDAELADTVPTPTTGAFVSSTTCRACHPSEHDSWHRTYHRTMTQLATPETVKGDFDSVLLEALGNQYELTRRGDEFWVKMPSPAKLFAPQEPGIDAGAIAGLPPVERRIVMVTGSHHMQTYWVSFRAGNLLYSFPFNYGLEADRWIPAESTFLRPDGPPRIEFWNQVCIKCHCVGGEPRHLRQTGRFDTRVAELGISCEACHGPAEEHVRLNQNPARRYQFRGGDTPDPTIVNPEHLSADAATQVCGQCHSASGPRDRQRWWTHGYQYRAGANLHKTRQVVRHPNNATVPVVARMFEEDPDFLRNHFWDDGMIRITGREFNGLIETPCYQRGDLSCLSCHSMHSSDPNDQLKAGMDGNQACLQCHSFDGDDIKAHTHHAANSEGSRCYNCHMPHTTYGLYTAIRSHLIDNPSVAVDVTVGRPNACNLCHLDQTLAWTARWLSDWYGAPPVELSPEQQTVSATVLSALRGDAGLRVLAAWHMGWEPAKRTAGNDWLAPFLAPLLKDPYAAVRYVAQRSLRRLPGYESFEYDFLAPAAERTLAVERAMQIWDQARPTDPEHTSGRILIDPTGALDQQRIADLLARRDDRPIDLRE